MERHYRVLLVLALTGIVVGIIAGLQELAMLSLIGCLCIPSISYLLAIIIDLIRHRL